MSHARSENLVGSVFAGRYRIEAMLGCGGMGAVYRARDEQLDEVVALKVMTVVGAEETRRFHQEVRLARRITHANVARTHDIGEHEGRPFMTMELIEGESLDTLLGGGPLAPDRAAEIALAVAQGLAAAHDAGVVHRDLKPANVLVERNGRVVITDFGIAKSQIDPGAQTQQALGTPHYMAPEQVLGEPVSPATDVYAFGLLLFEMLSGKRPFRGDTGMAELLARCRGEAPDPAALAKMPEPLATLVRRCLELAPIDRPPSARALIEPLQGFTAASAKTVAVATISGVVTGRPISNPFAPMVTSKRTLAVMPFAYRGPAADDYLGESLSQELIDVLSRTRGLRVLALGATAAHRDQADPRAIGKSLGAEAIVTGSVLASGERVRVSARLVDVDNGVQLWSDRFDRGLEDVFELQEIVSQRIADALRVELDTAAHRFRASAEAIDLYLRARRELGTPGTPRAGEAVALLEQSLAQAPDFAPAMAAHAIACVRAWWTDMVRATANDWAERTRVSVERALERAPDVAETHLAHGMYALQLGDLPNTAAALALALQIAPTLPSAHRYLGELQAEAGRVDEGMRRLKLAYELDPSLDICLGAMARVAALRGDHAAYTRLIDELESRRGAAIIPVVILRVRVASWRGDEEALRAILRHESSTNGATAFVGDYIRFLLGELDQASVLEQLASVQRFGNQRLVGVVAQISTEGLALRGFRDAALATLEEAAQATLVDLEWLDRCPALASLRDHPRFGAVVARVRERATAIWNIR